MRENSNLAYGYPQPDAILGLLIDAEDVLLAIGGLPLGPDPNQIRFR